MLSRDLSARLVDALPERENGAVVENSARLGADWCCCNKQPHSVQ